MSETIVDDQNVYIVREFRPDVNDKPVLIFEDDSDALSEAIDYCTALADDENSRILEGEFHAAKPAESHMDRGDWYLGKEHGVGVGRGLGVVDDE